MNVTISPDDFRPVLRELVAEAVEELQRKATPSSPAKGEAERPLLVDSREAARLLGITQSGLAAFARTGKIRPRKLGRLTRYSREELLRVVENGA